MVIAYILNANMEADKPTCLEERVACCRRVDLILITVIVLTMAATVILIVVLSPWNATTAGKTTIPNGRNASSVNCVDVAVIGGGVGGSYFSWSMRNRNLSIHVFEYSDRIGGRLFSKEFPGSNGTYFEFGGMRFFTSAHPILTKTVRELGLNIVPMPHGTKETTLWYLRGTHLRKADIGTDAVPYRLETEEPRDAGALLWHLLNTNLNLSSDSQPSIDEMYRLYTKDGTPLYKMSVDNFLGRYASLEARDFIRDMIGRESTVGIWGSLVVPTIFAEFPGDASSHGYSTVEGGMEKVPEKLMEKFLAASNRHKLHLNHQLIKIEKRSDGNYNLVFRRTATVDGITTPLKAQITPSMCAKKVVLTVQKSCVEQIDFPTFIDNPQIMKLIRSVDDVMASKIFLAYESQWWKKSMPDVTEVTSDLQTRLTFDWVTGSNNVSIILASYNDHHETRYWRELSKFGKPIPGSLKGANAVTDVVKSRLERYLSMIYNVSETDIPEAVGGGMVLWDTYPYQAAWNFFKPGVDEREVLSQIRKPSASDDVYLVSNSWSRGGFSVWSEGSLEAVDEVIKKYF